MLEGDFIDVFIISKLILIPYRICYDPSADLGNLIDIGLFEFIAYCYDSRTKHEILQSFLWKLFCDYAGFMTMQMLCKSSVIILIAWANNLGEIRDYYCSVV